MVLNKKAVPSQIIHLGQVSHPDIFPKLNLLSRSKFCVLLRFSSHLSEESSHLHT